MTVSTPNHEVPVANGIGAGAALQFFSGGLAKHRSGETREAEIAYRTALALDPVMAEAIHMLGAMQLQRNNAQAGFILLHRTSRLQQVDDALARNISISKGILEETSNNLLRNGKIAEAADGFLCMLKEYETSSIREKIVDLIPHLIQIAYKATSVRSYMTALQTLRPVLYVDKYNLVANLIVGFCKANMRLSLADMAEAKRRLRYVISMDPANPLAWRGMILTAMEMMHMREGLFYLYRYACIDEESFRILPDFGWSIIRLQDTSGFRIHEEYHRIRGNKPAQFSMALANGQQHIHTPEAWDGVARPQKTILITADGAIGDIVMFSRYILLAAKMFKAVYVRTLSYLEKILGSLDHDGNIYINPKGYPEIPDYQCNILTMMNLVTAGYNWNETVPSKTPYLKIDRDRVAHWEKIRTPTGITVGISWQSNGFERCIPFSFFEGLIEKHEDVRFVVIQPKLDYPEDVLRVENAMHRFQGRLLWPREDMRPEGLYDTAALILNLDLVITTCTGPAHITGALGKPFWVALQIPGSWMWVNEDTTMPWYPTGRLFRQDTYGQWDSVFKQIDVSLRGFTRTMLEAPASSESRQSAGGS